MVSLGEAVRDQFMLDWSSGIKFVNHGSYGAVPRPVFEAKKRLQEEMEGCPDIWFRQREYARYMENIKAISEFLGADAEDMVFVQNATSGINTVLKNLPLGPQDTIMLSNWTYIFLKDVVRVVSEKTGASVALVDIRVPIPSKQAVIDLHKDVIAKHENIKVAILDGIVSCPAVQMPVKELIELCRDHGILSLVDGAHMPGHLPLDLGQLRPDYFVGNIHKWGYAPRGCAILYVRPEHQSEIHPLVTSAGAGDILLHKRFVYQGTDDRCNFFVVSDALDFYNTMGGLDHVTEYCRDLANQAVSLLTSRWGTPKMDVADELEAPRLRMVRLPELPLIQKARETAHKIRNKQIDQLLDNYEGVATVIIAFTATSPDHVTLQPGQLVTIRRRDDPDWWEGELHVRGHTSRPGKFPADCVQLLSGGHKNTSRISQPWNIEALQNLLQERFKLDAFCVLLEDVPYLRLSANIYNCLADYEAVADAVDTLRTEAAANTRE